jgi:GNAT superfamily N-acetyltransferase
MIKNKPKLSFRQISNINDIHFEKAITIYDESFPSNEKQPISLIKKRVTETTSSLFVGLLNNKVVCMALLWDFKDLEFMLLDYMAVDKEHRNNKIGTSFFEFLSDTVTTFNKYMIIEAENYLFGNHKELRKQRINFYIRNGAFILKEIPYILPSLDKTIATEMLLMISPRYQDDCMDFEKIEKLITYLYTNLYDKSENDALLISILKNTPRKISQNNTFIP